MDIQNFLSLEPSSLPLPLRALWYDGHEDWKNAHEAAQAGDDRDCAWVHAYLHRKEGDQWNAEYWYRRAGMPVFSSTFQEEWEAIVTALLARTPAG